MTHGVESRERDGFAVRELSSPDGLVAAWAPQAGMICFSLRWRGEELLGQRKGLRAYVERGSTMGIPLLHPWANRLARRGYALGGVKVELPADSPLLHPDPNGLPIHGLLAGCPHWVVEETRADAELDARCIPTGATRELRIEPGPLGGRSYDDLFTELDPEPVFVLAGGGRRIEVAFGAGYPVAVVYAPENDDVVCFEPMTAPTNPFEGGSELRWAAPGEPYAARFSIRVS